MNTQNELKKEAGYFAADLVASDMVVGLGTGSTAQFALERIAARIRARALKNIVGIPTSTRTENSALELGIPLGSLDDYPEIDLTIDGADEVDPQLDLIKGGGGALLREKIIAQASRRNIIIVDAGKLVPHLGTNWAVPVEVIPLARETEKRFLTGLGAGVSLRMRSDDTAFITSQRNLILDADFKAIDQPDTLAARLNQRAGIVEHGLFLGLATDVIVAEETGIRHLKR